MAAAAAQKTSWADDVDDQIAEQPKIENYIDENGVRVTVEYSINDEGKKVKITRKTRRILQKSVVEHAVAERKKWAKFGQERGNKDGPDPATTTVGENVFLKLSAGNKSSEPEQTQEQSIKGQLQKAGAGKVACRLCRGDHFTAKCPYKDSLAGIETADGPPAEDGAFPSDTGAGLGAPSGGATGGSSTGGKYVPPSMRAGARGAGEAMGRSGRTDDLPTLRVTNISEDTQENDLRDLFGRFGRVARVYVGRDRETGAGKGFAFVSFEEREVAQRAMEKVHGMGYDNLILSVQWSQPRPDGR